MPGAVLPVVSGSYGADGTEYRTEENSFARITLHRSPQNQIALFKRSIECSGYGTGYTSSGFESSHGNDYSGVFTRVEPSAPSGFSGSAAGGNGAGAPVQAAERRRLVSMPTGPSAPAGAISGPTVKAGSGGEKWNPYTNEGRIGLALFGSELPWQDPLEPYKPAYFFCCSSLPESRLRSAASTRASASSEVAPDASR